MITIKVSKPPPLRLNLKAFFSCISSSSRFSNSAAESGGVIDIASLGGAFPMLYGNVVAILSSGLICIVISLAQNKKYDWKELDQHLSLVTDDMSGDAAAELVKREQDEVQLKKAFKFSLKGGGLLTLIVIIFWPMPLYFSGYVFDFGFYGLWVGIAIVWVSVASAFIIGLPIVESRKGFAKVFSGKKESA